MRELTKSLFSFSWAMSLFGIQQTANLMSPEKVAKAFDSVSEAACEQFTDAVKTTFKAGDKLQRSALDLTMGGMTRDSANPNKWLRMASDAAKQSAEAVNKSVQGVASTVRQAASTATDHDGSTASGATPAGSQRQGWGPMPS